MFVCLLRGRSTPAMRAMVLCCSLCRGRCYPWRCLCFEFEQITRTTPRRWMTLHLSQIFFTDARTFIISVQFSVVGSQLNGDEHTCGSSRLVRDSNWMTGYPETTQRPCRQLHPCIRTGYLYRYTFRQRFRPKGESSTPTLS